MPRIVDGDNLLGTWPGRKRSEAERRRLAHQVSRLARREGRRVVLVFDGPPLPGVHLGPDVRFSGHGHKADEVILDVLRGESDRRGWIAVTDDRPLGDQCRYLGAQVERCSRFRRRLAGTGDGEKPDEVDDVDYWLGVFGEE